MIMWILIAFLTLIALWIILFPMREKKKGTLFGIVFSMLALSLYLYWGSHVQVAQKKALDNLNTELAHLVKNPNMDSQTLFSELNNLQAKFSYSHVALAQLGNICIQAGLFDKAIALFEQAMMIDETNIDYTAQWIYSHSLTHRGKLPQNVRIKAQSLVTKDPTQNSTINLLAIDDYFQGRYPEAIAHWQYLLKQDETLSLERRGKLEAAISQAKKKI